MKYKWNQYTNKNLEYNINTIISHSYHLTPINLKLMLVK